MDEPALGGGLRKECTTADLLLVVEVPTYLLTEAFAPETRYYTGCTSRKSEPLSVGWGDLYPSGTRGQDIVVNAVPNGTYCF